MFFKRKTLPQREKSSLSIGDASLPLTVTRSKKRKHTIAFKLDRDGVQVFAPFSASLNAVTKILQKRAAWLQREWLGLGQHPAYDVFADGALFPYLGHDCRLVIKRGGSAPASCRLVPHRFIIHVPDEKLSGDDLRCEIELELRLWCKRRAKILLKKRCDLWAARMGVTYKKMMISDPARRWGSCSVDNIIRLNWRLLLAPLPLVDYVVAHELAHACHKNHSVRFWSFLGQGMPDWRARRQGLRQIEKRLMI